MAMAHSYREGPAWREDYGLSPVTWVDSSESYGARYEPAPAARTAELSRRQSAPHMSHDSDLAYSQQAEVLGSTANYLMYEYDKKRNELYAAARRGDAERARMLVDEMRSWTDENRSSLVRWKDAGAPEGSVAAKLSAKAFELDGESYLDAALYPKESDYNTTVRELLDSRTPEAKQWALESAKKRLGLGSAAAAVYSDPDNPLYDALAPQRLAYQSATNAINQARGKKDVAQSLEDQRRAEAGLQVAAEFAGGHGDDDPERVRDFLKGAQRSSWFGNASRNRLDDLFQMYLDDYGSGRVRDSAGWFGQLDESLSEMLPTQRRLVPQQDGSLKVVEETSQMTRPDRLPGMLVQARGILDETRFGATDYRTVSSALKQSVQKADVLARMAGVDDPQLIGLGDAAVADAVYGLTGDESLLQASYRGVPLKSNGRTLDDAYAGAVRLANVMGVNMGELTPVNGASADAPGLLGATAVDVYRAVLRHRLDGSASEDALVDKVEEVLARGSRDQGGYHELAREVVSRIKRNEETGLKMDFGQLLREIGGSLEIGTARTQDGREVPVMQQVVPLGNRAAVDYATGKPMGGTPDARRTGALSTDSSVRASLSPVDAYAADRALEAFAKREPGAVPYEEALKKDGLSGLADVASAVAGGFLAIHRAQDFGTAAGPALDSMYEGVSRQVGSLLLDNMRQAGVGFDKDADKQFVKSDLVPFLDGFDKWTGIGSGDFETNTKAASFADSLADRISRGEGNLIPLFARVAVELANRRMSPGVRSERLLTTIGMSSIMASPALSDPSGYGKSSPVYVWNIDDSRAELCYKDIQKRLARLVGAPLDSANDVLANAGYKDHDIGKLKRNNDYSVIFRVFDLNWRKNAPVVNVGQTTSQDSGSVSAPQAFPESPAVATANRLLSSLTSADEELDSYMSELLGQAAPMFHEPKAAQYYVASLKPLLQDKLRREGSAATRAWVAQQGRLRRHVAVTGRLADGTPQYGQTFISPEDEQSIIERDFKNSRVAYDADQRYLAIQKDKFDSTFASAFARAQASSLTEE